MLKKCACGGGAGPEGCEEGRRAKAKPRGYTERRGRPAEQRCIKDTTLNHRPCLRSSRPLTLRPYFQKDQHEGKQQSLHYCCYHFQTAIFQAKTIFGTPDVWCVWIDMHGHLHVCFRRSPCVYSCWFCERRVIFCQFNCIQWDQSPLAALPSALAQLGMDLPLHGHSGHWSHPHIEVMKENSVPLPWLQRWGGTQGTRWLAFEATSKQLTRTGLAALRVMVPGCLAQCCPRLSREVLYEHYSWTRSAFPNSFVHARTDCPLRVWIPLCIDLGILIKT